jgi:DNA adenine methylase
LKKIEKNQPDISLHQTMSAKPFLKWAGGKGQLIPVIEAALPEKIYTIKNLTYAEPFIGSGAVLFWFLQHFPNIKKVVINDINIDLVKAYTTIKKEPLSLIGKLNSIKKKYSIIGNEADRKLFYLEKREKFNTRSSGDINNTALLIFLNKTCFNGLYRINSKNKFNVPFGRYENPKISDPENIIAVSKLLQKVKILHGDYTETLKHISGEAFFYFDPPYKPISKTSSFNAYAKNSFDDAEQKRLKNFCDLLTEKNILWLLSNSDTKNNNADDLFFDELYKGDSIFIDRVKARRTINSNASKRGEIFELLISNYPKKIPR